MILAIDTATRHSGVAVHDGVQVLGEITWVSRDHHTVELAPVIADLLRRAKLKVADLGAIAVSTGPGSFTGMRIGLSMAKGLALSAHLPLVGIPTLDIVAAAQVLRDVPLAAVLQAGRGRLAVQYYTVSAGAWQPSGKIELMDIQGLARRIQEPTIVCGELEQEEQQLLRRKRKNVLLASPAQSLRRPSFLAELAWRRWKSGKVDDPGLLSPIYVHAGTAIPE
jgi:tRNA threonylcarbamoyladenosine biosynthesis protein TsaB